MNVGVYIWDTSIWGSSHPYWRLVKTFSIWSDAEEYATKKYGYPESPVIIQLTKQTVK